MKKIKYGGIPDDELFAFCELIYGIEGLENIYQDTMTEIHRRMHKLAEPAVMTDEEFSAYLSEIAGNIDEKFDAAFESVANENKCDCRST